MLELRNATVGYGRVPVLRELSAAFETGRLTAVIGANGCGKSTLLKALSGILPLSSGELFLDGDSPRMPSRSHLARHVAYLAQGQRTPDMTVAQLVLHGRFPHGHYPRRYTDLDRSLARDAMDRLGILPLADLPLHSLSGGMRQTAYLAMALAQDTEYILLDEPTTYLDIAHQLELMRLLRRLADGGKGIVAVMHDLPLAFDFSDEIAVVADGGIALRATPEEVSVSPLLSSIFGVSLAKSEETRTYTYRYPQ